MVRWLLKRPSSLEMGKPWKDWLDTERATEVWLLPCKVIKLITCTQRHRISQEVIALWGYHPVSCNCLSQRGLRHGRIQTNSIMPWLLAVPFPTPTFPAFSFSEMMAFCLRKGRKFRIIKSPQGQIFIAILWGWSYTELVWIKYDDNADPDCFSGENHPGAFQNKELDMVSSEWIF